MPEKQEQIQEKWDGVWNNGELKITEFRITVVQPKLVRMLLINQKIPWISILKAC